MTNPGDHPPGGGAQAWRDLPAPTGPAAPLPPFVGASTPGGGEDRRPWWGLGDVLLGLPVVIIGSLVASVVIVGLLTVGSDGDLESRVSDPAVLTAGLLSQQAIQGGWPLLVSTWKGLGPARDWRLRFRLSDLAIGPGVAIMTLGISAVVGAIVGELVGLADPAEADNTQFLRDAEGTWLVVPLILAVVVGAPLAEELFFRGLVLRAFEKRWGAVVGVIGSTVVFTLPHYTGAGLEGTIVLLASISVVGVMLAGVAVLTDRLGPTIIAHMVFNAIGVVSALGLLDGAAA